MNRTILFVFIPLIIFSAERSVPANSSPEEQKIQPWFTGPLIAAGPTTIPAGHFDTQPYFLATKIPAQYVNDWEAKKNPTLWSLTTLLPVWIGITDWLDLQLQTQFSWNHQSHNGGHWVLGDSVVQLDFQLYRDDFPSKNWVPNIKIAIRESLPTGKYDHLNPKHQSIDLGGSGSWASSFVFVMGKMFHLSGDHYFTARINGMYTLFVPVRVHGFNAYGGGNGTKGTVYPKPNVFVDLAFELSLTKNWAFAIDFIGIWRGTNRFSGKTGTEFRDVFQTPTITNNTQLASIQYSIAPAIEYNFSANLGLIAGTWITLAGKNSSEFYSTIISLNYYK